MGRKCELNDIVAVTYIRTVCHVNNLGVVIGKPVTTNKSEKRGWKCVVCNCEFKQWKAVLSYLKTGEEQ